MTFDPRWLNQLPLSSLKGGDINDVYSLTGSLGLDVGEWEASGSQTIASGGVLGLDTTPLRSGNIFVAYELADGYHAEVRTALGASSISPVAFGSGVGNGDKIRATTLSNGNVAVVYWDNTSNSIAYIIYDERLNVVIPATLITGTTGFTQGKVAALADGNFVVAYTDSTAEAAFQIFDIDGDVVKGKTIITTSLYGRVEVVGLKNGNFMIGLSQATTLYFAIYDRQGIRVLAPTSFTTLRTFIRKPLALLPNGQVAIGFTTTATGRVGYGLVDQDGNIVSAAADKSTATLLTSGGLCALPNNSVAMTYGSADAIYFKVANFAETAFTGPFVAATSILPGISNDGNFYCLFIDTNVKFRGARGKIALFSKELGITGALTASGAATFNNNFKIGASGQTVNLTSDAELTASSTTIPTSNAVKTYIDAQVSGANRIIDGNSKVEVQDSTSELTQYITFEVNGSELARIEDLGTSKILRLGPSGDTRIDLNTNTDVVSIKSGSTEVLNLATATQVLGVSTDTAISLDQSLNIISFKSANAAVGQFDANGLTLATGVAVNKFSNDATLGGYNGATGSDAIVATEKAVRGYIDSLHNVMRDPTGFVNRTTSTMAFGVDSSTTFSIEPTGAFYDIYLRGQRYFIDSSTSINITDVEGMHYIYFNSAGVLSHTTTWTIDLIYIYAYVAAIYWDATNKVATYVGDERHGIIMDGATHYNLHNSRGTVYLDGLGIGDLVADGTGSLNTEAEFSVSAGTIVDEDIITSIPIKTVPAQVHMFHKSGGGGVWRSEAASNYPVINTGSGRMGWNQNNAGTWQMTEATEGYYTLTHIFATNDFDNSRKIIGIAGQSEYATLTEAREASAQEINNMALAGLPFAEFVAVASFIFQTSSSYTNTSKASLRSVGDGSDYLDWRYAKISAVPGVVTDHGSLSGLGDDDHLQYARLSGTRAFTGLQAFNAGLTVAGGYLTLDNGVAVNDFSNDTALGGDSSASVPTEHAVKTYVDTAIANLNPDKIWAGDSKVEVIDDSTHTGSIQIVADGVQVAHFDVLSSTQRIGKAAESRLLVADDSVSVYAGTTPVIKTLVDSTGVTSYDQVKLYNTTAASSGGGAVQNSPALRLQGSLWDTDDSLSKDSIWDIQSTGGSGAAVARMLDFKNSSGEGTIKAVSIDTPGTGYSVDNILSFGPNNGCKVRVLAVDTGGEVLTVELYARGQGITTGVYVTTGGGNNDFKVNVTSLLSTIVRINSDGRITTGVDTGGNAVANIGPGYSTFTLREAEGPYITLFTEIGSFKLRNIRGDYSTYGSSLNDHFVIENGTGVALLKLERTTGNLSLLTGVGINEFSNDDTLGGDSSAAVPTEHAVKSYVDSQIGGQANRIWEGNSEIRVTDDNTAVGVIAVKVDNVEVGNFKSEVQTIGLAGDSRLFLDQSNNYADLYAGSTQIIDGATQTQVFGVGGDSRLALDQLNDTADLYAGAVGIITGAATSQTFGVTGDSRLFLDTANDLADLYAGTTQIIDGATQTQVFGVAGDSRLALDQFNDTVDLYAGTINVLGATTNVLTLGKSGDTYVTLNQLDNLINTYTGNVLQMQVEDTGVTIQDNLTVRGNLSIDGTAFVVFNEEVRTADNIITVNDGDPGPGVTRGIAGLEIDRGSSAVYQFIFHEDTDTFRVGETGQTQAVATREDDPDGYKAAWWNDATRRFETLGDEYIKVDQTSNNIIFVTGNALRGQFDSNGLTLQLGTSVNEFSTDVNLSGASNDAVPTEAAVKSYVDSQIGGQANLIFQGNSKVEVIDDGTAAGTITVTADGVDVSAFQAASQRVGLATDSRLILATGTADLYAGASHVITATATAQTLGISGDSRIVVDQSGNTVDAYAGSSASVLSLGATSQTFGLAANSKVDLSTGTANMFAGTAQFITGAATAQTFGLSGDSRLDLSQASDTADLYAGTAQIIDGNLTSQTFGIASDSRLFLDQGNDLADLYAGTTQVLDTSPLVQVFGVAGDTLITLNQTANSIVLKANNATQATFDSTGLTLAAGTSVDEFSTDVTLGGNSNDAVPTEKAVKTYVDTEITDLRNELDLINVKVITTDSTAITGDVLLVDTTAANIYIELIEHVDGKIIVKKKTTDSNKVYVTTSPGTIDGQSQIVIDTAFQSYTFVCDGGNFFII
jgi:hypothetical protein